MDNKAEEQQGCHGYYTQLKKKKETVPRIAPPPLPNSGWKARDGANGYESHAMALLP